jgi:hypothetical protein
MAALRVQTAELAVAVLELEFQALLMEKMLQVTVLAAVVEDIQEPQLEQKPVVTEVAA